MCGGGRGSPLKKGGIEGGALRKNLVGQERRKGNQFTKNPKPMQDRLRLGFNGEETVRGGKHQTAEPVRGGKRGREFKNRIINIR